jgi:FPC/CPF motif-containing protein YcgG
LFNVICDDFAQIWQSPETLGSHLFHCKNLHYDEFAQIWQLSETLRANPEKPAKTEVNKDPQSCSIFSLFGVFLVFWIVFEGLYVLLR